MPDHLTIFAAVAYVASVAAAFYFGRVTAYQQALKLLLVMIQAARNGRGQATTNKEAN